ncbi:hypothetical protein ALP73_01090 [Pseudomonas coronafaciens pv. garcae]|uniref:hypothetical protein n=1 Tax=Pseudomonas syringae group TaxID=136849 RepID=UPI000F009BDC|nr:hypothetical protein [Pseudomonas coronafaciens]RMS09311.1 hypothetical protein ALP73_01090 [Pseudomonas coronafaciens pv. garcae]
MSRQAKQQQLKRWTSGQVGICKKLLKLSRQVHQFKARAEFLTLAFQNDLVEAITSYELWDYGFEGLGEREFDNCFEMGDSADVIAALITNARREGFIEKIKAFCDPESFEKWCSYADRQGDLFGNTCDSTLPSIAA